MVDTRTLLVKLRIPRQHFRPAAHAVWSPRCRAWSHLNICKAWRCETRLHQIGPLCNLVKSIRLLRLDGKLCVVLQPPGLEPGLLDGRRPWGFVGRRLLRFAPLPSASRQRGRRRAGGAGARGGSRRPAPPMRPCNGGRPGGSPRRCTFPVCRCCSLPPVRSLLSELDRIRYSDLVPGSGSGKEDEWLNGFDEEHACVRDTRELRWTPWRCDLRRGGSHHRLWTRVPKDVYLDSLNRCQVFTRPQLHGGESSAYRAPGAAGFSGS
jgi:hypothetical protein